MADCVISYNFRESLAKLGKFRIRNKIVKSQNVAFNYLLFRAVQRCVQLGLEQQGEAAHLLILLQRSLNDLCHGILSGLYR